METLALVVIAGFWKMGGVIVANAETLSAVAVVIGAIGSAAAVFVSYLANKAARAASRSKEKIDMLALGQTSLKDALERADIEIAALTGRVDRAEKRAAESEERERDCLDRVSVLMRRVDELERELHHD